MRKLNPHQHHYLLNDYSRDSIAYRCRACDDRIEVKADPEWRRLYRRKTTEDFRIMEATHKTWQTFCKKFREPETMKYLHHGHDLIVRIRKWAKNRTGVQLVHIDDAQFTNSLLVLFEHGSKNHWMGLTVLVVSQTAPYPPVDFFLYPDDAQALFQALRPELYRKVSLPPKRSPTQLALYQKAKRLLQQRQKDQKELS
jgi:hypothetical protein